MTSRDVHRYPRLATFIGGVPPQIKASRAPPHFRRAPDVQVVGSTPDELPGEDAEHGEQEHDPDGDHDRQHRPADHGLASPSWVAGDSAIVVIGQAVSGQTDVYRVRVADGAITQLTNDPSDEDDPVARAEKIASRQSRRAPRRSRRSIRTLPRAAFRAT